MVIRCAWQTGQGPVSYDFRFDETPRETAGGHGAKAASPRRLGCQCWSERGRVNALVQSSRWDVGRRTIRMYVCM